MSLAREKPFQHLTNDQVIQNAEHMYYGAELQVFERSSFLYNVYYILRKKIYVLDIHFVNSSFKTVYDSNDIFTR